MTSTGWRLRFFVYITSLGLASFCASARAVELANINVTFDGVNPNPPTVAIPGGQSTSGFFLDSGQVLGEYPIRIGASATDDPTSGVLLGSVRENGRNVSDPGGFPLYSTSSTVRDTDPTSTNSNPRSNGLSLAVHRAGAAAGGSAFPTNAPFAANLGAAYFPFSEGWLAGTASASVNNGALDTFVGSPGLALGTNFVVDGISAGKHRLTLPGVIDSRRQGLLFVNHAKNEGNYALSEPADDGNGWVVVTHDNATDGATTTTDPVSFVFIPLGTPNVTMAKIHPHSGQNLGPVPMLKSGSPFTITLEGTVSNPAFDTGVGGKYRLSIPGQSPSTGVLMVSPSTVGRNANGGNTDNIVTYEADGNDWIILAQDLPNITGEGVFSRERNSYFSFAFVPFNAPPSAPATIPAPKVTKSRIWGFNSQLIREAPGEETGGTYGVVTERTSDVEVQWLSENYGDYSFSADGDFLTIEDGIPFATVTEGIRNNTATGGGNEYGIVGVGRFVPEWTMFVDGAANNVGEHEVNIATTFFGINSGFQMAANVTVPAGGQLSVTLPGVTNTNTDGVFFAQSHMNEDNVASAAPKSDGSGWDVELRDDGSTLETDPINYIYLPYSAQNLVAGRVDEDGTLLSSTNTSGFTLTKTGVGEYTLSIPGKSPQTGMLMLTGTGDNTMIYESVVASSNFKITGLDLKTAAELTGGQFISPEDTEFSFAYIDFQTPPSLVAPGVAGDYNGNGTVDAADYVLWRNGGPLQNEVDTPGTVNQADYDAWRARFGNTAGSGSGADAVPEPSAVALMIFAGLFGAAGVRRRAT